MAKTTSHPPIGVRNKLTAKQALNVTNAIPDSSIEARIERIVRLISGIVDEFRDAHMSIMLFQEPQRWILAMKRRDIAPDSFFSLHLQKIIVIASMQSLCRLWDPKQNNHQKFCFADLLSLFDDETIKALELRTLANLETYGFSRSFLEIERTRIGELRDGLVPRIKELVSQYDNSKLKATRDGWIAHNDIKFDINSVEQAMAETISFFKKTEDCLKHIYAFVENSEPTWSVITNHMEFDAAKFRGDTTP